MKLSELMTKQVHTCRPTDSVQKAAQLMQSADCGIIPICEGKKLVGVLTDRDICMQVAAQGRDPKTTACQDCMTSKVITGTPDMDAHEASDLMAQHQIRRLPIVQNGELVGICAIGDLAVVSIHENEAGYALSEISEGSTLH